MPAGRRVIGGLRKAYSFLGDRAPMGAVNAGSVTMKQSGIGIARPKYFAPLAMAGRDPCAEFCVARNNNVG